MFANTFDFIDVYEVKSFSLNNLTVPFVSFLIDISMVNLIISFVFKGIGLQ